MKMNKREAILVIAALFVLSGVIYYTAILTPITEDITEVDRAIEQKQIKILSMQNAIAQIDVIKTRIDELEKEMEKQSEDIPRGISQPMQLVTVTNIMNDQCDSLVISFDQGATTYEDYQKNTMELSFSTSYDNLVFILDEFDKLDMTNQIVNMNVQYTEDTLTYYTAILEGYYVVVGMTVEFYSFYADPNAEPMEKQPFEVSPIENKNPFKPSAD